MLMYNRIYKFFSDNNLIYVFQFGFRQKHPRVHALFSLTEIIRKNLDDGNFGYAVFLYLQKGFHTAEHDIFLSKFKHYDVRGLANERFKSYISNRKQYVSINGYDSNFADVKFGVPQGAVPGPLFFQISINDLIQVIKSITLLMTQTYLLYFSEPLRLNKYVNLDLKNLTYWLNINKIPLNMKKKLS